MEMRQYVVLLGHQWLSRMSYFCTAVCVSDRNCRCVGHVLNVASSTIFRMSIILVMRCRG